MAFPKPRGMQLKSFLFIIFLLSSIYREFFRDDFKIQLQESHKVCHQCLSILGSEIEQMGPYRIEDN